MPDRRRVDIHHHVVPPGLVATTPMPVAPPTVGAQLELMDSLDIQTAVLSITPRILDANPGHIRAVVRACNEHLATLIRDHPSRFGAFGALPLPDVDGALEEVAYAFDVLGLDGVGLFSNQGGMYLGDPAFDDVFAELNRREAVVFVHPAHCEAPEHSRLRAPAGIVEYVFDTTRAVVNLLYNGTLERNPNVRMIMSHAAGAAPFILTRITHLDDEPHAGVDDSLTALRALYYDTTSATMAPALRCIQELADTSHVVWGTDAPFIHGTRLEEDVRRWSAYPGFDAAEKAAIERENALRLLPSVRLRAT
jgi:6-methylsalicylate decarboxylase